jgi:hypothetical protein
MILYNDSSFCLDQGKSWPKWAILICDYNFFWWYWCLFHGVYSHFQQYFSYTSKKIIITNKNCSFWPWFALIKTKWGIIIEDLTNIMSAKIGFNWPSSSEEKIKMWNAKDLMTTDNGRKMIANVHLIFEVKFSPFSLKSKTHLITGDMLRCLNPLLIQTKI